MIKVDIGDYSIHYFGHADYAPYGHDIVCAAASMLIHTMAMRGVEMAQSREIQDAGYHIEPGVGWVKLTPGKDAAPAEQLMGTVILGFRLLEAQYPDHVQVVKQGAYGT